MGIGKNVRLPSARTITPKRRGKVANHKGGATILDRIVDCALSFFPEYARGQFNRVHHISDVAIRTPLPQSETLSPGITDEDLRDLRDADMHGQHIVSRIPSHLNLDTPYKCFGLLAKTSMHRFLGTDLAKTLRAFYPGAEGTTVLSFTDICEVLTPVMAALSHLHFHGVVHNDLKSRNVMLCVRTGHTPNDRFCASDYTMVLTDCGFAMRVAECGYSRGTFGYISPEQNHSPNYMSHPSTDVYSLAVLVLALTFHMHPEDEASMGPWVQQKTKDPRALLVELKALPNWTAQAATVLVQGLCRQPVKRATLEDFLRAFGV